MLKCHVRRANMGEEINWLSVIFRYNYQQPDESKVYRNNVAYIG